MSSFIEIRKGDLKRKLEDKGIKNKHRNKICEIFKGIVISHIDEFLQDAIDKHFKTINKNQRKLTHEQLTEQWINKYERGELTEEGKEYLIELLRNRK